MAADMGLERVGAIMPNSASAAGKLR